MDHLKITIGCYFATTDYQMNQTFNSFEHYLDYTVQEFTISVRIPEKGSEVRSFSCPFCKDQFAVETVSRKRTVWRQTVYPVLFFVILSVMGLLIYLALSAMNDENPRSTGYWILAFFTFFPALAFGALAFSYKKMRLGNTVRIIAGNRRVFKDFKIMQHQIINEGKKI